MVYSLNRPEEQLRRGAAMRGYTAMHGYVIVMLCSMSGSASRIDLDGDCQSFQAPDTGECTHDGTSFFSGFNGILYIASAAPESTNKQQQGATKKYLNSIP